VWHAVYTSADGNNLTASDNGSNETTVVSPASPTLSTTILAPTTTTVTAGNVTVQDRATISAGFSPTGTLTFDLFTGSSGGSAVAGTHFTITVAGNANYDTTPVSVSLAAGTYHWVVSYTGDANNNKPLDVTNETFTVVSGNRSGLFPTQTTIQQFINNPQLGQENTATYGVKSGKINNVAPGVLFYFTSAINPSTTNGTFVFHITQTIGGGLPFLGIQSVQVVDANGNAVPFMTSDLTKSGDVTFTIPNAVAGATYYAGEKIQPNSVVGQPAPSPTTVTDTYATVIGTTTVTHADLTLQPNKTSAAATTTGSSTAGPTSLSASSPTQVTDALFSSPSLLGASPTGGSGATAATGSGSLPTSLSASSPTQVTDALFSSPSPRPHEEPSWKEGALGWSGPTTAMS
jgi:hypothetical protein